MVDLGGVSRMGKPSLPLSARMSGCGIWTGEHPAPFWRENTG